MGGGGINAVPQRSANVGPRMWIDAYGPSLLLSSSPPIRQVSRSGIGIWAGGGGQGQRRQRPHKRDEGEGMIRMTTITVAMGGAMPKDGETGIPSRVAATAMAPPNISSALPLAHHKLTSFARGWMWARKLSSRSNVDNNDNYNGANDDRWFRTNKQTLLIINNIMPSFRQTMQ
jgi:hypothetical protein